jgi:hypothetical protein
MIGEPAAEDGFGRMDTAPLDLSGLHQALDGAARVPPRQPATSPSGGRDSRRWPRKGLFAACILLLIGAPVVLALPPFGRGLPSQAALAAPGSATPTVADTGWQGLELSNGWFATGDGARYRVRDGVCYLQGHVSVRGGTWPAYTDIGVLPASAAPAWNGAGRAAPPSRVS